MLLKEKLNFLNKDIALLTIINFLSKIGYTVYITILTWYVGHSPESSTYVGFLMSASIIPNIFFGPTAGAISDKYSKKHVLLGTQLIIMFLIITIACVVGAGISNAIIFVIGFNFLTGTVIVFNTPAFKALIPSYCKKANIVPVNSLISVSTGAAKSIGALLAGTLLTASIANIMISLLVASIFYMIVTVICVGLTNVKSVNQIDNKKNSRFIDGIKYINSNKPVKIILIFTSIANIFLASISVLLPSFVSNVLRESAGFYSKVNFYMSLGGTIICILVLCITRLKEAAPFSGLIKSVITLGFVLVMIPFSLLLSKILFVAVFFYGVFSIYFDNMFFSYLQEEVEIKYLGRTIAASITLANIFTPISYIIFGLVKDAYISLAFLVSAIALFADCFILKILARQWRKSNTCKNKIFQEG